MANDESASGGADAGDEVGGGGGGKSILGGAAEQAAKVQATFIGPIFPAPLDEHGALREQSLRKGLGRAHLIAVVFPFQQDAEMLDAARAELDKKLGQPFFAAYLYPNPFTDEKSEKEAKEPLFIVGGGGGGKSILGGAAQSVTYIGQFRAVLPNVEPSEPE